MPSSLARSLCEPANLIASSFVMCIVYYTLYKYNT
jgi:hypothetical protein